MRPIVHLAAWSLGLSPAETQTTAAERACLARYAEGRRHLLEVGVWHGVTTAVIRRAMDEGGRLVAVDPFYVGRLGFSIQRVIATREVGRVRRGEVEWVRMTSEKAVSRWTSGGGAPFDFVFIDGDHSYEAVRTDWEGWSPRVESGGIVALHDSRSTPRRRIDAAGSVRFTNEVILRDPCFEQVDAVDSLTVMRRVAPSAPAEGAESWSGR